MGWLERMKEMDIVKLRILVFTLLVFSFLFALALLKIGAERLGLSGGVPPLLKLVEDKEIVVKGDDIDAINKSLGKKVVVEDRIKRVDSYPDEGLWVVKLTYISVPLGEERVWELRKKGIALDSVEGMAVRVEGVLKIHPIYGLQLSLSKNSNLNFVTGRVRR